MKNKIENVYKFITTLIRPEYVRLNDDTIIMSKDTFKQLNYIQNLNYHTYHEPESLLKFYKVDKDLSSIQAACDVKEDDLGNIKITII